MSIMTTKHARQADLASPPVLAGITASFVHGLGQVAALVAAAPRNTYPDTRRTAAEALGSDWDRLGQDMRRGAEKVMALEAD